MDGQGTECRRKIAENYNRLSRVHERYRRQTDVRQTDGRQHIANVNASSRSLTKWRSALVPMVLGWLSEYFSCFNTRPVEAYLSLCIPVVNTDVRTPYLSRRQGETINTVVVVWVPNEIVIIPALSIHNHRHTAHKFIDEMKNSHNLNTQINRHNWTQTFALICCETRKCCFKALCRVTGTEWCIL